MKVERASVRFVGQWVLASTLGWIGGLLLDYGILFLVIRPIDRIIGLPVIGIVGIGVLMAGVGTGVGIMQWLILRRQFSLGSWWVFASTIGWAMGGCLVAATGWWDRNQVAVIFITAVGTVAGFGTGIMQWLILRRQFSQTGWWILASTVAWGVGMAGWTVADTGLVSLIALIVGLVVAGAITGIALVWLTHPQEMRFMHKLGYIASVGVLLIIGTALLVNVQLQEKKEINALIEQLRNEDEGARWRAAERLERLGGRRAKAAVPALIELLSLSGEDPYVRQSVASALGSIGKPAKDAVPALMESLNDESEYVRLEAAGALGRIDKSKLDMVLPLLIEALGSGDDGIRANAASALGDIGWPAKDAVPALAAVLNDESESVRHNATNALREIGTSEALKVLKEYQQK